MTDSLQRGRPSGSWPHEWRCLCWVAGRVRGWWLTDSFDQLAIAAGVLHCATWLTARHYCWATVLILRCLVSRWLETGTDRRHHDVIFYYFSVVAFPIVTAINSSATVVLNRPGQKQWRRRNFRYLISGSLFNSYTAVKTQDIGLNTEWAKKLGHRFMTILILSNLNRSTKFFHWKIP